MNINENPRMATMKLQVCLPWWSTWLVRFAMVFVATLQMVGVELSPDQAEWFQRKLADIICRRVKVKIA